jgi:gluconokinase
MGAAGAGKTTVGARLARALGWNFLDGDDLLPPASIEKLRRGIGLTDMDREPWLQDLRVRIDAFLAAGQPAVVACSALRQAYRERLRADTDAVRFVYLKAEHALLRARVETRKGHFFAPSLLDSQLAILEEPRDAVIVDAALPVDEIVARVRAALVN